MVAPLPAGVTRSRLLLGIGAVMAGTAVLFVVLGAVFNLILALVALPFAAAAYFLWMQATGQLQRRVRRRFLGESTDRERREAARGRERARRTRWERAAGAGTLEDGPSMGRREALETLDLEPDASERAIRRAYRDRVKAVHPDAEGGDEDEFRRVRAAYERLRDPGRGKG